jgi:hypothetical protein
MSAPQYYVATTVQSGQYVVLLGDKVVAGPFPSAKAAIEARDALLLASTPTG